MKYEVNVKDVSKFDVVNMMITLLLAKNHCKNILTRTICLTTYVISSNARIILGPVEEKPCNLLGHITTLIIWIRDEIPITCRRIVLA